MVVGSLTIDTDVAVIGGGPGGYVAAIRAGQLGKDVTLIEEKDLGGICLHHGCIPTKAIIHASNYLATIQEFDKMGIHINDYSVDLKKMKAWKDEIITRLDGGIHTLMKKYGVEVITGRASFKSSTQLSISGKSDVNTINFKQAIIATGSLPIEIPGFPFSNPKVWSSRDALQLDEVPKSLIIIGGGYIGTELGTVFAKLGAHVQIVEMTDRLLPQLDHEIVDVFAKKFADLGVKTHFNSKAKGMEETEHGVKVHIQTDGKDAVLEGDKVLVVVGRHPNTKDVGLENTKVVLDNHGFINVDEQRRTSDPDIFAVGDVIGQPMLAHKASREGKVAAEVICGKPSAFDNKIIPFVVFNDPEIASVGMTEEEARKAGKEINSGRFPFSALGRALTLNRTEGFVKFVAEKETGTVLGMHCVGPGASDIISEAALAIEMAATVEDIAATIHPHPTLPESLMEAAEATMGASVHIFNSPK
ncbi:MAG: dihydrolipoyl dehydrogenase [Nanoarchaeota archaeon]